MTIIRAREWRNGKPIGPTQVIEPKPKTLAQKGADAVERGIDRVVQSKVGCGDCRAARAKAGAAAKEILRKVIPR